MDLQLTAYCPADCAGRGVLDTIPCFYEMAVIDGSTEHTYFAHVDTITVGFSDEGYAEVRVNRANVYRYTPGDTFNGGVIADSQAMYEAVRDAIGGGVPPVVTYYILAETGDILNAENADRLRTETP